MKLSIWGIFICEPFFTVDGVKYEDAAIGLSLERVLRYFTIRGKLTRVSSGSRVGISAGIHPGLKAFGVQKIEIDFDSEEVAFIFEGIHIIDLLLILY